MPQRKSASEICIWNVTTSSYNLLRFRSVDVHSFPHNLPPITFFVNSCCLSARNLPAASPQPSSKRYSTSKTFPVTSRSLPCFPPVSTHPASLSLFHLIIYLSIYLSIYRSIYLSIYLSIYPSIDPSIHPSIYLSNLI